MLEGPAKLLNVARLQIGNHHLGISIGEIWGGGGGISSFAGFLLFGEVPASVMSSGVLQPSSLVEKTHDKPYSLYPVPMKKLQTSPSNLSH